MPYRLELDVGQVTADRSKGATASSSAASIAPSARLQIDCAFSCVDRCPIADSARNVPIWFEHDAELTLAALALSR
jgi:hypothetical protein